MVLGLLLKILDIGIGNKNMKKSILIIFCLLSVILLIGNNFKDYFYKAIIELGVMKPCYRADKDYLEIFRQEGLDYLALDKQVTADGLKKLANIVKSDALKIPTISHHIYLTSEDRPNQLNAFYIEKLKASFNKLNKDSQDWQHYIWTNKSQIFPQEIIQIKGVQIKQLEEFKDHVLYQKLLDYVQKGNEITPYLAGGSDLLRLMALQKFGGMYNDMDYEIYNPKALNELFKSFDYVGGRETTKEFAFYGNAFIASKPKHPIIEEALRRTLRNEMAKEVPGYIKYPCSEHARIYANGPALLTMSYFVNNNIIGNVDIILPTYMIMNATFARFKNIDCNYNSVTKEVFNERENNLEKLLQIYPINTKEEGVDDSNIYYSIRDRKNYPIIGSDMFCGGWSASSKLIKKRIYYWSWKD